MGAARSNSECTAMTWQTCDIQLAQSVSNLILVRPIAGGLGGLGLPDPSGR